MWICAKGSHGAKRLNREAARGIARQNMARAQWDAQQLIDAEGRSR